jgi:hypothetical protein
MTDALDTLCDWIAIDSVTGHEGDYGDAEPDPNDPGDNTRSGYFYPDAQPDTDHKPDDTIRLVDNANQYAFNIPTNKPKRIALSGNLDKQ